MSDHPQLDKEQLEQAIVERLKNVYDPEIPVDIYELGLVYEIKIDSNSIFYQLLRIK